MANDASHDPPASYTTWRPPSESPTPATAATRSDALLRPSGSKSLSGISLRAFLLGANLGLCLSITVALLLIPPNPHYLWRLPFFVSSLSLFHFLEYYITAAYNTRYADISAFLLSSNGWAYNFAHSSASVECLLAYLFYPYESYFSFTSPVYGVKIQVVVGIFLMALGQVVRSLAMAQAGSNFNHTVQVERREGHMLVTHGVYAVLRHPSYFGFFWWGIGTQLMLGNVASLLGYAVVLWKFFSHRIDRECSLDLFIYLSFLSPFYLWNWEYS